MARAGACVAVALALAATSLARAQRDRPAGAVLWVEGRALYRQPLGGGERTSVAALPVDAARIRRIEVALDGSAALLDLGGPAAWLELGPAAAPLRWLPCHGDAHLSPSGGQVVCDVGDGAALLRLRPTGPATWQAAPAVALGFGDGDGQALVAIEGDRLRRHGGAAPVELAPAPSSAPSVAPDGSRGVGRFADGGDALFSFRLDGQAARRKLIDGIAVAWSADSAWILAESAIAACAVRAVGGEYKCWDGFRGRALAPDGSRALLSRANPAGGVDLFHAPIGGAQTTTPAPAGPTGVPGAAALLP